MPCSMEERFEYYWRVYTLTFQLGMKHAVRCEGFRHIIAISAPGCNITYSPFIWLDDRGQVKTLRGFSADISRIGVRPDVARVRIVMTLGWGPLLQKLSRAPKHIIGCILSIAYLALCAHIYSDLVTC